MKSADQRRNARSRKFPYGNLSCPSRSLLWIAFVLCSIAVFSESVEGLKTESRDKIGLLGDRVELDCITNSSHPVEWSFLRPGSSDDEVLAFNSQLRPNISDSYSIVTKHFGQVTLVIDPLLAVLAGRYKCLAIDDAYKLYALYVKVTVLDPFPVCDQSRESLLIVCRFLYAGNLVPDFDWLTSGNIAFCNESVDDSSAIGSVRMNNYNSSDGHSRCKPQKDDGHSLGKHSSPLNYAAVKGEHVRLNCSRKEDDTGFWFRNTPLSADEILIYHKKLIRNGWFSIDESVPGHSDLLFTLWKRTSGRYGCDSVDATHTAEVVGLDKQPSCSWETKTGFVNASCSIGFSGNWPPVIDWYRPTGEVKANSTITIRSQRVTSILIVPLTGDPQEVHFITCSVKFRIEDKPQETTATNIPEILPSICRVTIEASDPGSAASNKGVPKLNDGMAAEKSDASSELVGEYWQTESHYRIVLLGDRVELDCFATSSHPLEWYFKPYGSSESEFINVSSQADSNVTNTNRILKEDSGHATLIIDRVLLTDAGRYECHDTDGQYKLSVEVIVVDPNPTCNQSTESSSIVCPFRYAGNVAPDFKWSTSENATFCSEFGNDSSAIASLLIKNYKSPAGRWRCKPPKNDALTGPLNYGAVKGELVRLNCSKREDDTGYWFLNAPLSADEILIYHRRKTSKNIWFPTNESDPIRSDLLFTASESTSGRYGCDSFGATHTAEVIVSDSKPSCSWETKTGFVNASCSIGFSGNWPPVIDWYNPMGKVEANATTIPSHSVSSFLTLPLTDDPHELYYVTCSVKFRIEDKPPETTATNIPENHRFCQLKVGEKEEEHGDAAGAIDVDQAENIEHGDAAGAIDVDQAENIDPGPAAGNKGAPKWNDGTAENDKPKPSIGSGRESFVLLQLFLAFIAAFVGFGQF